MRVAICLSGLPRFKPTVFESYRDFILQPYNADVFIHCWADESPGDVCEHYEPTVCHYEPQIDFSPMSASREGMFGHGRSSFGSMSMFYSLWRANRLKAEYEEKNGFKYDIVVRTRFDIGLDSCPPLHQLNPRCFYPTPTIKEPEPPLHSDIFWIAGSAEDDLLCGVYPRYEEIVVPLVQGKMTCNEEILIAHIAGRVTPIFFEEIQTVVVR